MAKRNTSKKCLITGATGFIGRKLGQTMLEREYDIVCLTRNTQHPKAVQLAKLGATIVQGDLMDESSVMSLATHGPFTSIFHLGASLQLQGTDMEKVNILGTENIIKLAHEALDETLIFASSIEAQGLTECSDKPLTEDDTCSPISDYGRAKLVGEKRVQEFAASTGKRAVSARIGNVYGAGGVGFTGLLWRLLFNASPGDIMLQALPKIRERWLQPIYVDDVVRALISINETNISGIVNLTGSLPVTIESWLNTFASLLNVADLAQFRVHQLDGEKISSDQLMSNAEAWYFLIHDRERYHRVFSDGKLRAAIGHYQKINLTRGTAKTIAWFTRQNNPLITN